MVYNEFPIFVADQLLSPDNLNDLFNYLDEQEHYTRTCLIGIGIACGLHLSTTASGASASVTISKGCGVTSSGYLVHFPGDVYTKYLPYNAVKDRKYAPFVTGETQTLQLYELKVDAAPDPGLQALTDAFLTDKVAVLFVEVLETHAKNCDPNSCDDKGINVSVAFRPLLVSETDAASLVAGAGGLTPMFSAATLKLPVMSMRRVDVPATSLLDTAAVFQAFLEPLNDAFFATLQTTLDATYAALQGLVPDLYSANPFAGLISKYGFLAQQNPSDKQLLETQYYYDLFSDVLAAYEELRSLAARVSGICCPSDDFPRHLLLGKPKTYSQYAHTDFRHYFIPSPALKSEATLLSELRSLFIRLAQIVNGFSVPAAQTSGGKLFTEFVRLTPSTLGPTPLSQKAVPYYYSINPGFLDNWDRAKTQRGAADQNLSYHSASYGKTESITKPLFYDLEPYNFLRVEGHIGQPYKNSLSSVQLQRSQHRLPIDVIALSSDAASLFAKATAAQKEGDLTRTDCYFNDLESLYQALEKRLICFLCKEMKYYYGISNAKVAPGQATLVPKVSLLKSCDPEFRYAERTVGEDFENWYPTTGKTAYTPALQTLSMSGYSAYLTIYNHYVVDDALEIQDLAELEDTPTKVGHAATKAAAAAADTGKAPITVDEKFQAKKAAVNAAITDAYIAMANQFMRSLLYYIQRIYESLNGSLAALNIDTLSDRFDDLQQIARVNKEALAKKANDVPTLKTEELLDHLDRINYSCDLSEFRSLAQEFERRWRSIDALRRLAYYAKKCPGLQHKAGVPMGGTFILVYHEPTPDDLDAATLKEIGKELESKDADKILKEIWNDLKKKKASKLDKLIEDIPTGTVIADFYLPFICCSDCPPIHFEVVEPDQPEVIAQISITPAEFCNDNAGPIPITVSPPGGTVEGDGAEANGTSGFVFYPNKVNVGKALWREVRLTYEAGTASASATVKVFHEPTAAIKFTKRAKLGSGHVEVDGANSTFVGQYSWDFGDGTPPVTGQKATHDYTKSGDYVVTLTVTNGACSDQITETIAIRIEPPTISLKTSEFCNDIQGPVDVIVSPPGGKLSIDGTNVAEFVFYPGKIDLGKSLSREVKLAYTVEGVTATTTVKVYHPPTAEFKMSRPPVGSGRIIVDAIASTFVSKYLWNFGDGSPAVTTQKATHDYEQSGLYLVTLTVTNGTCSATVEQEVVIRLEAPVVTISIKPTRFCHNNKGPIPITVSPPGGELVGDAVEKVGGGFVFIPAKVDIGQSPSKDVPLKYVVDGIAATAIVKIDHKSNANIVASKPVQGSGRITVDASASTFAGGGYEWDFGDGSPIVTTPKAIHEYKASGLYVIKLTVANGECLSTDRVEVQINLEQTPTEPPANCIPRETITQSFEKLSNVDPAKFEALINAFPPTQEIAALFKAIGSTAINVADELSIYRNRRTVESLTIWLPELKKLIESNPDLRSLAIELFRILTNLSMRIACIQAGDINAGVVPSPALTTINTETAALAAVFSQLNDTQKGQVKALLQDVEAEQLRMGSTSKTRYKTSLDAISVNLKNLR